MNTLDMFIKNLCGKFNNSDQISKESNQGKIIHPKASHINGICNTKISNIPEDFNGYFVIEESYYEQGSFKNSLPHLFLFTLNKEGNVVLTSYDIPEYINKEDFRNDNTNLRLDFNTLKVSKKFTPMVYKCENGIFEGESLSHFTPVTTFILKETIKNEILEVSEIFEQDGVITFGFADPIIYKKIL
ncbi:MAG: hypothetical protein ACRCVJ_08280 [Clostridium sp.]|uniref:hypothetical protein n=1 Tax=Clostridium sp. TaxID=1506 RepID=UPI003F3918AC